MMEDGQHLVGVKLVFMTLPSREIKATDATLRRRSCSETVIKLWIDWLPTVENKAEEKKKVKLNYESRSCRSS